MLGSERLTYGRAEPDKVDSLEPRPRPDRGFFFGVTALPSLGYPRSTTASVATGPAILQSGPGCAWVLMQPGPELAVPFARNSGRGRKRCGPRPAPAAPTDQVRPASPRGRTCCAAAVKPAPEPVAANKAREPEYGVRSEQIAGHTVWYIQDQAAASLSHPHFDNEADALACVAGLPSEPAAAPATPEPAAPRAEGTMGVEPGELPGMATVDAHIRSLNEEQRKRGRGRPKGSQSEPSDRRKKRELVMNQGGAWYVAGRNNATHWSLGGTVGR
jgi:hypothetical protein